MSDAVKQITDQEFQSVVLDSALPVLVDFWAPWCGPCRMLTPIVEALAEEYAGQIVFTKMNTDENQQTPGQYGIMSIPSLLLFKDGELLDKSVGLKSKPDLAKFVDQAL